MKTVGEMVIVSVLTEICTLKAPVVWGRSDNWI